MKASKTICFFNSAKTWGGGEKWHYETALFMKESGHDVLFITSPGSILQNKLSQKIKCIPFRVGNLSFLNPVKVLRLKNIFRAHNVNVIIINLSADLKLAGLAAKYAHTKRIIYRRGSAIPIKNNFLNRFYFRRVLTDVLANSAATKETILQNNPSLFPREKIKVIYNPIPAGEFLRSKFQPVYKKAGHELVIGNIGRLVPQKNQRFLIDLAARLKERQLSFKILIGGSGPLEESLKNQASREKVTDKIIFCGFLENVKDLLMSCDLFILPSLWEGFGYVLAEASLCQKPVIAFHISSNPELVLDNKTGFLCDINDMDGAIEKINLLHRDISLRDQLGENGRSFITDRFNADKISAQLLDYLTR